MSKNEKGPTTFFRKNEKTDFAAKCFKTHIFGKNGVCIQNILFLKINFRDFVRVFRDFIIIRCVFKIFLRFSL